MKINSRVDRGTIDLFWKCWLFTLNIYFCVWKHACILSIYEGLSYTHSKIIIIYSFLNIFFKIASDIEDHCTSRPGTMIRIMGLYGPQVKCKKIYLCSTLFNSTKHRTYYIRLFRAFVHTYNLRLTNIKISK